MIRTLPDRSTDLQALALTSVLDAGRSDVGATRERVRQARLLRLLTVITLIAVALWLRILLDQDRPFGLPQLPASFDRYIPIVAVCLLLGMVLILPLVGAGKSPHVLYRPGEIDVSFADVRGADDVVEEAVKTLNLFLAHRAFSEQMGGTPRRGVLFDGPPGTGKTYLAKAMAAEAGVPFLFVSSSAFQSMFYGQTNRKIRSYFRALRRYARKEGGAIGFIEEIDAIGASRSGNSGGEGVAGVVNELLIQLQSFDQPTGLLRVIGWFVDQLNGWLPARRQLRRPTVKRPNVLVVAATNRAADLDPALLRPGRFDRTIYFDLPSRAGRRSILDFYLDRKAHDPELDSSSLRDELAAMTFGYSPVMIEHLLDESLVWALRRGGDRLSWADTMHAKMTESIGVAQPVAYTELERRRIATHEAGHATVASLVGQGRKLDVLSIVKRRGSLGLLAHSDTEERFVRSSSEISALIEIAFGGMVAEELFFGETSSGVASDLHAATEAACQMIGSFGMGDTLISTAALAMPGNPNLASKVLASDGGRDEVEAILRDARAHATTLISEHREIVEALRDALLEQDELVGDEITTVIHGAIPASADTAAATSV